MFKSRFFRALHFSFIQKSLFWKRFLAWTFVLILPLLLVVSNLYFSKLNSPVALASSTVFDPTNLSSDAVFTANNSMSEQDIQNFLVAQNSVLATIPSTMLGAGANGRSAAQIIYDYTRGQFTGGVYPAGYAHYNTSNPLTITVNPQVVLATLQKEQSLIGISTIAGLASYSLNSAMGMLCPDSGGCNGEVSGFTYQVEMGVAQLMINYVGTNMPVAPGCGQVGTSIQIHQSYNGTPVSVYLSNHATAALYCYTPYEYDGNHNFWTFMDTYFNPPVFTAALALDTSPTANGAVYAIYEGTRYPIDSMDTLVNGLGLNSANILPMTTAQAALPVGPLIRRLLLNTSGSVSYLINGMQHAIASQRVFAMRGFQWSNVSPPNPLGNVIPYALPYYELAKFPELAAVYIMTNNTAYAFPNPDIFANVWGMQWGEIVTAPNYNFTPYPVKMVTRLVQGSGSTVYLMDQGQRLAIDSASVFNNWQFSWGDIMSVDQRFLSEFPQGPNIKNLVKDATNPTVYLVKNGQKLPFGSSRAFNVRGYNWGDIVTVSDSLLNTLPTGGVLY
jgi:hypothetical protein